MDVVAKLKERIALLTAQREQAVAQVNAMTGAIQVCELLLSELAAPPAPEPPPAPLPPGTSQEDIAHAAGQP